MAAREHRRRRLLLPVEGCCGDKQYRTEACENEVLVLVFKSQCFRKRADKLPVAGPPFYSAQLLANDSMKLATMIHDRVQI